MKKSEVIKLCKENKNELGIENWKKIKDNKSALQSYGIGLTQLRKLAKEIGKDHKLALQLWNSKVYDLKVLGLLIDEPKLITREQAEEQVEDLNAGYLTHVFSTCGATLAKTSFVVELATKWTKSRDRIRRRCGWGLLYEVAKQKGKKAPEESFFLERIEQIEKRIHKDKCMWVRESMKGALMGFGMRSKKLNKVCIQALKRIGHVDVDYGPDNSCEPLDVMKHLTGAHVKKKLGL